MVRASTRRSPSRRSWRRCSASGSRAPARPRSASSSPRIRPVARCACGRRPTRARRRRPRPSTPTRASPIAQAGIDFTNEMFPGFAGMIPTAADGPQECLVPMALDFRSLIFEGMALVPGYAAWLLRLRHGAGVPLPPPRAQAAAVALPAGPLVAEDAGAHAVDRRARRRLPRRPLRDDAPRRRQGPPVGVRAVQHVHRRADRSVRPARHRRPHHRHVAHRPRAPHRLP